MNIINDTSSQTVITTLPTITGSYDPYVTSNELYTGFYTKGQTNTLLNAKENMLTFNAPLTRNINTIGIDLSSYLTTSAASSTYQPILSFSAPMTKTGNNVTIDLSSYATISSLNPYITSNSSSNIFLTIANASSTYATISSLVPYMTSNATSNIFLTQASASATYATVSSLNNYMTSNATSNIFLTQQSAGTTYATITALNLKENILTFSSPLTRTTNAIGIDLSAYSTTTTNNSTYLRLDGSTSMTSKLLILTGGQGNPSFATNNGGGGDRIVFQSGVAGSILPYSIGYSLNNFWMSAPSGATINTYIDGSIRWSVGSTGAILYGNLNASNILEGNTNLSSKYALSSSLANYVLKAGDTMSGALTVNGNINITSSGTNKLIFDNAFNNKKIELNSNAGFGAGNTDLTFYSAGTFTFRDTTLSTTLFSVDNSGSLSFNGRLYPGKGLYTDNVVTSTSNIISSNFIEGGVSLSSKYITSAALDTTYLRLNGANSMTGNLGVGTAAQTTTTATIFTAASSSNTGLMIRTNATTTGASLLLNNNIDQSATIALVATNFPASFLSSNLWIKSPRHIHLSVDNLVTSAALSILTTGSIGIGKTNPNNCRLYIDTGNGNTVSQSYSMRIGSSGTISDTGAFANLIGLGIEANGWSKGAIGWVRRAGWDQGDMVFLNRNTGDANDADLTYERMRISGNTGNVNIKNSLSINGALVNDFCFNNLGFNHADITDFNAPVGFGCRFIFGNTNGPSVTYGQQTSSYTLFMGLGINYPASGTASYGCQLALPRNVGNPTLSVRYKENNSWGGWSAITAGVALSLNGTATFTVNTWHRSSDNQQRLYFENNTTTYIQGQGTNPIIFRNNANEDIATLNSIGRLFLKTINVSGFDGITLRIDGANNYWNIFTGTTPTTLKTNSLIFFHGASGIASNWWLDGTQTNTNADISDKRSKYNVEDFTALETIEKLKPKSFDVIDDKDVKFQYGFIAQDVEEIPEVAKLVFTEPNYVANVNTYAKRVNDGEGCIITANNDLTGKIEVGDELKLVSNNNDKENQEFILDATPYHNRYKRRYAKVTEIISPTEFKVDCEINNLCCLDDDEFLIYGKKVEDAKSLDYNSFIALNTKAIQELYKIIKQQQETIDKLLSHVKID